MVLMAALLTACSTEDESRPVTVELQPCTQSFLEMDSATLARNASPVTRTWNPPLSFYTYNNIYDVFSNKAELMANARIGLFFTNGKSDGGEMKRFWYDKNNDKWMSAKEIESGTFYLYGFIPYLSGVTASVATVPPSDTFSEGAELTINGMPTVIASDVCVLVGANNGTSADEDGGLARGNFRFGPNGISENYVYLLFDHLYSSIRFSMKVDSRYNELRTIKLKKLELKPRYGNNYVTSKVNITVTLKGNNNGDNPIQSVIFAFVEGDLANDPLYDSTEGLPLTTEYSDYMGSFVPHNISLFTLVSTYDVYDKKGNLVRKDCRAENDLDITQLFFSNQTLDRGMMFTVKMTIEPTYLYMLSDPDLDNPTVNVEH